VTSQTVVEVTRCPLASRTGVLVVDFRVCKAKRRTKSSYTKSSVAAQSTIPEIWCPPSGVFTVSSVRINGRASVRSVSRAVADEENCCSVAMEGSVLSEGTCTELD
jgi:hypothetical protein